MAAVLHLLDQRRLIDSNGIADGGSIAFYYTGSTTPAPIYSDAGLTTPAVNPVVVGAGAEVPAIYLDSAITYKRVITYPDGSEDSADPFEPMFAGASGAGFIGYNQGDSGATTRTVQDRLRDFVSVRDFGAVGDDSANDTAAFAAAAATGKPVIIPRGTYRVAGCLFTARVYFMGGKIRRTGGVLAFSGGIDAAPGDNIFLDAVGIAQVDINNTLTPEGWVDWFGYDADAIETCHAIFRVNRFGPRDYYTTRTVILDKSYREVIGAYGSAEGAGGTRIIMSGAGIPSTPIIQVGTLAVDSVLNCARRLNIYRINTIRAGLVDPASSNRREDAVPGWKIAGWYEGRMEHCFDYGSPIHYRIYGTSGCVLYRCSGVRPFAGNVNGFTDFYTAFCVGGYSTSFGFIGSNGSIDVIECGTAGGTGTARIGLYLFGYIGDSYIDKFGQGQLEHGIYIDGADAGGTTIAALTAHQDVRVSFPVLDANLTSCMTITNINEGGTIQIAGGYYALNAAADGLLVSNSLGMITFTGGDMIANSGVANYGIRIVGSKRVNVEGVAIKDYRVGVRAESSSQLRLQPIITRNFSGGTNAVEIEGVGRSYVQPIIDSDSAVFDYGIASDSGTNYCEFNITNVNFGCFTTAVAGRKIWHNGASWGGGGTFGTGNIATGVLN